MPKRSAINNKGLIIAGTVVVALAIGIGIGVSDRLGARSPKESTPSATKSSDDPGSPTTDVRAAGTGNSSPTAPPQARLAIQLPPDQRSGVTVLVDGQPQAASATGPWEIAFPPGRHSLRVTKADFKPIEMQLQLSPGEVRPLALAWQPLAVADAHTSSGGPPSTAAHGGMRSTKVDLLPLIDPRRDVRQGQWTKQDGQLVCQPSFPGILTLPFEPKSAFTVTMRVTRTYGSDSIGLVIPFDRHIFSAGFDNFPGEGAYAGVEIVNGQRVNSNPLSHRGAVIENDREVKLTVAMSPDRLTMSVDDKALFEWNNPDLSRCSLFGFFSSADRRRLSLITWGSAYRITSLEVESQTLEGALASATPPTRPSATTPPRPNGVRPPPVIAGPRPVTPAPKTPDNPPNTPSGKVADDPQPAPRETPEATKPVERHAPPSDAELAKANKAIADLYRDEIKAAVSATQKVALAQKLLDVGLQSNDDFAGKYALLKLAAETAAPPGDVDTVEKAVDELERSFSGDLLKTKADLFIAAAKTPQNANEVVSQLDILADELVAANRFDLARRAGAAAAAVKCDPLIHKQAIAKVKEIGDVETEYKKVSASLETLKTNPDDPEANTAVGKFDCLVKNDWPAGLPLLAKGSDKTLAELAKADLKHPSDAAELVKLADGWWDLNKKAAKDHALELYDIAADTLTGIARLRVEKRMQEAGYMRGTHRRKAAGAAEIGG